MPSVTKVKSVKRGLRRTLKPRGTLPPGFGMPGLKGFFYTLAFASLALLAVLSLSFYAARGLPSPPAPSATGFIASGIGSDVMHLSNVSFDLTKQGSDTVFTARDYLPSTLSSPGAEMNRYEAFVSATLANRTSHNISLDIPASQYILQPFGLSYSHNSFLKNSFTIPSNTKTDAYSLRIRLNKTCLANNCGTATKSTWTWRSSGLGISLDIRDASNNLIQVGGSTSGSIRKTTTETFQTALQGGGYLNVTITSGALRVAVSGARADCITNTTLTGTPVSQVLLPATLSVDGISYSNIVLLTK